LIKEWVAPHGGITAFEPAERALLQQAANLFLMRVRGADQRIRAATKISRILTQVGIVTDRHRKREPAGPSLADYVAGRYGQRKDASDNAPGPRARIAHQRRS
jgi:hypothetical protein